MIYVGLNANNEVDAVATKHADCEQRMDLIWQSRWDWKSKEQVDALAAQATEHTGDHYIGTDAGSSVSPRFDIQRVPQVGDEVSSGFNGDYYPEGKIASISKSLKVITLESGKRFYRRRQTGSWVNGGTWSLVMGIHNERNPHL